MCVSLTEMECTGERQDADEDGWIHALSRLTIHQAQQSTAVTMRNFRRESHTGKFYYTRQDLNGWWKLTLTFGNPKGSHERKSSVKLSDCGSSQRPCGAVTNFFYFYKRISCLRRARGRCQAKKQTLFDDRRSPILITAFTVHSKDFQVFFKKYITLLNAIKMPLAVVTVSLSVLHFSHKTCMLQGGNQF